LLTQGWCFLFPDDALLQALVKLALGTFNLHQCRADMVPVNCRILLPALMVTTCGIYNDGDYHQSADQFASALFVVISFPHKVQTLLDQSLRR